jgi:glucose/arabinose dehydrogenase
MKKRRLLPVLLALLIAQRAFGEPPLTGPETEKRFPPLQVADGFRATLFACDPLIEYPSVLSLGPRPGSMFLAHDYLTGLGIDIVRRDEVRLVEDTDGDGYADKSTVYAAEFQSIQGLAFHDGTVYVMHAPLLTALRDTDGDGVADERRDLLRGLGLPPEENPPRLHCANGVVMGHDGWLYLALGDHGCDVQRPEGDCLVFEGGGILRCRADGRDLHVLSSGLRNIYDVALDEQLNVFVRDNENDGGDYKIRVCYCFFGSDHGYPYLYYERPEEALPPLADLGLGSSAGGVCYLETAFPEPYRGTLFFCEWGRSLVSYQREQHNSWFAPLQQFEFASGAAGDPYGFKPVDVIVDWDGSLLVADWADGQRPKRGRGRVYRLQPSGDGMPPVATRFASGPDHSLTSVSPEQWLVQLESGSYHARVQAQARLLALGPNAWNLIRPRMLPSESATLGRLGQLHGVWIAALSLGRDATDDLFELARDAEPDVALQAVRALADLYDPVLNQHRLDNMVAPQLSQRLAEIAQSRDDPRFRREAVIALGRWQWAGA